MNNAALAYPAAPDLSELHSALGHIERQRHALFLNRLVNDPSIYPWVHGYATGALDFTDAAASPANFFLAGEQGGIFFVRLQPGLYDAHSQVLPDGRGAWAMRLARASLHWMFTRSDALEIVARIPQGNLAVKAFARRAGFTYEFTNPRGWVKDYDPIPAEIHTLRIQDWIKTAPGLEERGRWFHERLSAEFARLGHASLTIDTDNATANRAVGVAYEMLSGGQPDKAVIFYNRWAAMSGYEPIYLTNRSPLAVNIASAVIVVPQDRDFWVASTIEKDH